MASSILDLTMQSLRRVSATSGGEWAGPCPWCGGEDRFRVWPENGPTGRFWCRACDRKGDGIQFFRDLKGLSFAEACQAFGVDPGPRTASAARHETPAWTPRETRQPSEVWKEKAAACVSWSEKQVWSDVGAEARRFLFDRGLSEATIREARLGWNPADVWRSKRSWGIEDDGKRLWIPAGLIIPCVEGGEVIRLRVRRPNPEKGPRYYLIPGSDTRAMVLPGPSKAVLVVESELDALLVHQEAGELVTVISLGNAQTRPDQAAHAILDRAEKVLVALDSDDAGAREAWRWWPEHYPQAERWPCIDGKDPGDMARAGVSIRDWVLAGLDGADEGKDSRGSENVAERADLEAFRPFPPEWDGLDLEILERLAIMTCNGLSDEEAGAALGLGRC